MRVQCSVYKLFMHYFQNIRRLLGAKSFTPLIPIGAPLDPAGDGSCRPDNLPAHPWKKSFGCLTVNNLMKTQQSLGAGPQQCVFNNWQDSKNWQEVGQNIVTYPHELININSYMIEECSVSGTAFTAYNRPTVARLRAGLGFVRHRSR